MLDGNRKENNKVGVAMNPSYENDGLLTSEEREAMSRH